MIPFTFSFAPHSQHSRQQPSAAPLRHWPLTSGVVSRNKFLCFCPDKIVISRKPPVNSSSHLAHANGYYMARENVSQSNMLAAAIESFNGDTSKLAA